MSFRQLIRVAIVLLSSNLLAFAALAGSVGFVSGVEGNVKAKPAGAQQSGTLRLDQKVSAGDTLVTAKGASLRLLLNDDTLLALGPSTEIVIDRLAVGKDAAGQRSIIREAAGHLRVSAAGSSDEGTRLEIQTPTAVVELRGATAEVVASHGKSGDETLVVCVDGVIQARNQDRAVPGTVELKAGMSTRVRAGKPPTSPAPPFASFKAIGGSLQKQAATPKGSSVVLGKQEDEALVEATENRLLKRESLDATNVIGKSVGPEEVFEQGNTGVRTR